MRTILFLTVATALTACQSSGNSEARWNDMWVDIALRHKYEKYSCGYRALEGYSKDSVCRHSSRRVSAVAPKPEEAVRSADRSQTAQESEQVRELEGKIAVLEEALRSNVATTNQNQALIVDQIKAIKAQLEAQQSKPAPAAPPLASGIHIPGN